MGLGVSDVSGGGVMGRGRFLPAYAGAFDADGNLAIFETFASLDAVKTGL